uniref:Uncharacterized protein AlNc14C143G7310 n=1 Tax=Albugo laibachii Nc14 TaxID=890382 RepID=F0WLC2_9STRA|nr:conserved hypothetical protein [Albugo laibachii Nc14]|eukprot:CCA22085.1 conserved hypothetical protein [Albugo laibachii Nc14]
MNWLCCFARYRHPKAQFKASNLEGVHVAVVGWERTQGRRSFVVYRTIITYQSQFYERLIRYRDFRSFHHKVFLRDGKKLSTKFPRQGWWFWSKETKDVIQARQVLLNEYMHEVCRSDLSIMTKEALVHLLSLDSESRPEIQMSDLSTKKQTDGVTLSPTLDRSPYHTAFQSMENDKDRGPISTAADTNSLDNEDENSTSNQLENGNSRKDPTSMDWSADSDVSTATDPSPTKVYGFNDLVQSSDRRSNMECSSIFSSQSDESCAREITSRLESIKHELLQPQNDDPIEAN